MQKPKVGVVFITPESGALGSGPNAIKIFERRRNEIVKKLTKNFSEMDLDVHNVTNMREASKTLRATKDVVGYFVFVFQSLHGLLRPVVRSGKPIVLIGETYGGAGDFLMEYSRDLKEDIPVTGLVTRDVEDENILRKYGRYLRVISKLHDSRLLLIVGPSTREQMLNEFPLSIDLYSSFKSVQSIFGITPILLDAEEFVGEYYDKVNLDEAENIAKKWIEEAHEVIGEGTREVVKQAKLYISLKKAVRDYRADAIGIDCIVLHNSGLLDAWPCLGFLELAKGEEAIPVCESDFYSATLLLIMKHLADRPGFVSDPSPDIPANEIVYYHCFAPINLYNYKSEKTVPYTIMPAHLGERKASVHVELPVDEVITAVGLSPEERIMTIHSGKAVRNERSTRSCATKLIAEADAKLIAKNWKRRAGWHRVVFYGDWREELRELARLFKLKIVEEDRDTVLF